MSLKTRKSFLLFLSFSAICITSFAQQAKENVFPDGTKIPAWFSDTKGVDLKKNGKVYDVTKYGVINDSTVLQTTALQKIIDMASKTGGTVLIPKGTFLSGALFFKPKTHLFVAKDGKLKGSDDIANYPKIPSRMEGQNLDYFAALVNAYGVNGFTISGDGTIDGNGKKYWDSFWSRRAINPNCTNLEVSRPRLIFIWKSNNVQVENVKLHNSGFWTSHYYQCNNIKILNLDIRSPHEKVKAPSTDAIDLDVCNNVLIKGCYLSVNDDAIALKGGKGPWADEDKNNGENTNIIIEDCEFGFCHSALTLGSESIHDKNILMRNCHVNEAKRVLWLKMRPDTPQKYEYVTVENITGNASSLIYVKPWTQFFDLKGKKEVPLSYSQNITLRNIDLKCDVFYDIAITQHDRLADFTFENLKIEAKNSKYDKSIIKGVTFKNVVVNGKKLK
nr:glycosyl hydrolase family 28 protein [uncultured Pedobacter sp.]